MLIQPNIVTKGSSDAPSSYTGSAVGAFIATHQPRWQWKATARDGASAYSALTLGTKPSTNVLYQSLVDCPTLVRIMPFTSTSTMTAANIRVVGWTMYMDGSTEDWIPTVLADVTLSRSSGTAMVNSIGGTSYYPFTGCTITSGTPTPNSYALSGTPASLLVDAIGSQLVQVTCWAGSDTLGVLWTTL